MELRQFFRLCVALAIVGLAADSFAASGQTQAPPPPPPTFHPRPGPWIVFFKPDSAEIADADQLEIIRAATHSWGRVERSALILCYDGSLKGRPGWIGWDRLRAVAAALHRAGSPRVLTDQSWLCPQLQPFSRHFPTLRTIPPEGVLIYGIWEFRQEGPSNAPPEPRPGQ